MCPQQLLIGGQGKKVSIRERYMVGRKVEVFQGIFSRERIVGNNTSN